MSKYMKIYSKIPRNTRLFNWNYIFTKSTPIKNTKLQILATITVGGALSYFFSKNKPKLQFKEPEILAPEPDIIKKSGSIIPEKDNERSGTLLWYRILRSRCQNGGPTFIKLAQWAASRSDIFPKYFCITLSNLHSQNKPHKFRFTKKLIKKSYGLSLEDMFDEFDTKPIGVGAIAQVYKAKLKPGIEDMIHYNKENQDFSSRIQNQFQEEAFEEKYVAVKVLHPKVKENIIRDLYIMNLFATLLDLIPTFHWLSLPGEVHTFGKMMKLQLDLREEAFNLLQLRKNFEDNDRVEFPKPHTKLITKQILIETYEIALPINKILYCNNETVYDKKLAHIGLDSFLHMLVYDNFIHSDLHPGNIMVKFSHETKKVILNKKKKEAITNDALIFGLKEIDNEEEFLESLEHLYDNGFKARLVYLDAGLVTTLDKANRRNLLDLFRAIAEFDGYKAGKLMIERSRVNKSVVEPEVFALKMQKLILDVKHHTFQLKNIQLSKILGDVMDMVQYHHVKLESNFVNVVISILILEGIGRRLDKNLDLFNMALPILRNFGTYDAPRYAFQNANFNNEHNSVWWLKLWVQLEARQWLTNIISSYSDKDIRRLIDIYAFDFFDM